VDLQSQSEKRARAGFTPQTPLSPAESATPHLALAAARLVAAWAAVPRQVSPGAAVTAAEAVSTSRNGLYRCLIELGWLPPPAVVAGMELDAMLVHESMGSCYDGMFAAQAEIWLGDRAAS
jgi:hypothetical protein